MEITYKGKTYRVTKSLGYKDVLITHMQVRNTRGVWQITYSRGATAEAVIKLASAAATSVYKAEAAI